MSPQMHWQKLIRLQANYHNIAIKILRTLSKEKLYEHSEFQHFVRKDYRFNSWWYPKLLSGVVYINPKNNSGTIFYDDQKEQMRKVDWNKQSRAFKEKKCGILIKVTENPQELH